MSTLMRWLSQECDAGAAPVDLHAELKHLRRDNAALQQERDILKKPRPSSRGAKLGEFAFIDAEKASFPICRMCHVLGVSQSGFFVWRERPACRRQRQDLVCLAHIRTTVALSHDA
ncbi:hypothetical protein [Paenirhodobacter sp.]|uniref:hypothetical protein n=1 Tax=Paenirhodobacter sp. TaxID=1965326 RepID=UPI003B3C8989